MKIAIISDIGNNRRMKSKNIKSVILPKFSAVDVNDKEDWDFTELLVKIKNHIN